MALLHLFARWAARMGQEIAAVTVDHGLREDSRAEAQAVAALCRSLGIEHDILTWVREEGAGNLAAAARAGRYGLMADWARGRGIGVIALGHTADDTAENFLMRLGRASGLDGLASMHSRFERAGVLWARPLWAQRRATLRAYLQRHGVAWSEDPSNDDPRYQRTVARRTLPALAELGIDAQSIGHSANALRQAQAALSHYTRHEAARHVIQQGGDLLIPQRFDPPVPEEIERRLTVAALRWVGSGDFPPRKQVSGVLSHDMQGQLRMTVGGCIIMKRKGYFHITREYNAVKDLVTTPGLAWDTRWRLEGPNAEGMEVRALGEAVSALQDWRARGVPRRSLMASPAVWRGDTLIAAPAAGYNLEWSAQIVADFTSFLLLH
jgi:tRNA(Ile)-lysidine synthase